MRLLLENQFRSHVMKTKEWVKARVQVELWITSPHSRKNKAL